MHLGAEPCLNQEEDGESSVGDLESYAQRAAAAPPCAAELATVPTRPREWEWKRRALAGQGTCVALAFPAAEAPARQLEKKMGDWDDGWVNPHAPPPPRRWFLCHQVGGKGRKNLELEHQT